MGGRDNGASQGGDCSTIAGGYSMTISCAPAAPTTIAVTVSLIGSDVVITDGSSFRSGCTLSGCDCTTKRGEVYKFTPSGFTGTETPNVAGSSGCSTTTLTGTKK